VREISPATTNYVSFIERDHGDLQLVGATMARHHHFLVPIALGKWNAITPGQGRSFVARSEALLVVYSITLLWTSAQYDDNTYDHARVSLAR